MRILLLITGLLLSNIALADWQVDNSKSSLHFISVKKNSIGETHTFETLSGSVSTNGDVKFDIDLASVNTNIAIRDERMRKFLFETNQFASATFNGKVDSKALVALARGIVTTMALSGDISLHGQSQKVSLSVSVVKLANGDLIVSNIKPLVIQAEQFALTKGLMKLQELAGLPSISSVVPVSFSLYLKK